MAVIKFSYLILFTITSVLAITQFPLTISTSTTITMEDPNVCRGEIVSFSACLPFTASPPNNFSSSTSTDCCSNFNEILVAGHGFCLCYLLRQPPILGFPLDSSKIFSLSSLCPPSPRQSNFNSISNFSLQSLCSDFEASPPRQISDSEAPSPLQNSGSPTPWSPSPKMDSTSLSTRSLPLQPQGSHEISSQVSSATRNRWSTIQFKTHLRNSILSFRFRKILNTQLELLFYWFLSHCFWH